MISHSKHPDELATVTILEDPVEVEDFHIDCLHRRICVHEVWVTQLLLLQLSVNLQSRLHDKLIIFLLLRHILLLLRCIVVWWARVLLDLLPGEQL